MRPLRQQFLREPSSKILQTKSHVSIKNARVNKSSLVVAKIVMKLLSNEFAQNGFVIQPVFIAQQTPENFNPRHAIIAVMILKQNINQQLDDQLNIVMTNAGINTNVNAEKIINAIRNFLPIFLA